jgi:hypothetical protein
MPACPFCGHGKYRLKLKSLICRVLGHRWSEVCTYDYTRFSECERCMLIQAWPCRDVDRRLMAVLLQPYEEWRRNQPARLRGR